MVHEEPLIWLLNELYDWFTFRLLENWIFQRTYAHSWNRLMTGFLLYFKHWEQYGSLAVLFSMNQCKAKWTVIIFRKLQNTSVYHRFKYVLHTIFNILFKKLKQIENNRYNTRQFTCYTTYTTRFIFIINCYQITVFQVNILNF